MKIVTLERLQRFWDNVKTWANNTFVPKTRKVNGKGLDKDITLTAEDMMKIEDWFGKTIWGVKEEVNVKCPKCGKESSRAYVLALEDFFSAV